MQNFSYQSHYISTNAAIYYYWKNETKHKNDTFSTVHTAEPRNITHHSIQTQQVNLTYMGPKIPKKNQSRRFQNQWGLYQSRGQMGPEQFQGSPLQMNRAVNPLQWAGQESSQFQSQDHFQYPQVRGQMNPSQIQFARNPSQWRGQGGSQFRSYDDSEYPQIKGKVKSSQIQFARNPFQGELQRGVQFRSQDDSEYPQMRDKVNPNQIQYSEIPSQSGRQEGPQLRSQVDPEYLRMQVHMNRSQFYKIIGGPLFWRQDSKEMSQTQTKNYEVYLRQGKTPTTTKKTTAWKDWLPPHASAAMGSTNEEEKEFWKGWTGAMFDPNAPQYNLKAPVSAL